MDFLLSLTHFCEVHGPTSILCSQVLPFSCTQCHPDAEPAPGSASSSPRQSSSPEPRTNATDSKSPKIEDHPYFLRPQPASPEERHNRVGGSDGDTCASCSLSLPEGVSKQLPSGTPGSRDSKGNAGSPVLRSREVVYSCGNSHSDVDDDTSDPHMHASPPDSLHSSSVASDASCHTHILTYLSQHGPPNPADYALLRRSSIRTLSCELLPRGLSSGPLCFGDSVAGYTIAYIFRLPDPMARGKRRSYALVALAGKDAGRAFRACPVIWRAFGRIASSIVSAAERFQEEEKRREEKNSPSVKPGGRQYTPVSSFLTGRAMDPAGQPRRLGQIRARNLAEIVGNEYIFAELHAHFVALLQQLGSMFGGVPISEDRFVCSTVSEAESSGAPQPVLVSQSSERSNRQSVSTYDGNDIDLAKLDIAGPKPIPLPTRRSVVA
ncbi:Folliculin [Penicillium hispanicum]|uniref:Folliculin n=1 Tax=Penicillium hispanicum TaxID=1080232 RepID=UPI002540E51F|nr:Folliculin [Penicillium hispanicum]KAJ5574177.1 Folliculin [Penicillium hispanicum]